MGQRLCLCLAALCAAALASDIQISVSNQVDNTAGLQGRLNIFLSTSFQPAEWDSTFFQTFPGQTTTLGQLAPQHINVQSLSQALAQTGPSSWDFTTNDAVNQPIIGTADHNPLYEIATAPAFMMPSGSLAPANFSQFAGYSANLVRYFNAGGFDAGGTHYQSPTPYHVTWWGIFNEPNGNGIASADYPTLYNTVVPAMQAVDPNLKFVAVELSDYTGQAASYLPPFIQNVNARVDVVATHFYGSCNQMDPDTAVFGDIATFVSEMQVIRTQMQGNPALANVPIWVTEDNVNADYGNNGISVCNPGQPFVTDLRGSSAFFAAWRPLVFEQLAKVGAESLHHWDYDADAQYGEVNYNTGATQLSYWVDYWLSHLFSAPPGADILQLTSSDTAGNTDAFAVRNADGSAVVMLIDHQIASPTDNNGTGVANTFALDVSALGSFTSVTQIQIDAATDPIKGPQPQTINFLPNLEATLPGYGVVLFKLNQVSTTIGKGGIVNAASYQGGAVAPGEVVTIFGQGMGPSLLQGLQVSSPGFLDNSLVGTRVWFDGTPAALIYTSAGQVSAIVPYAVAGQSSTQVQVEYLGSFSPIVTMPVAATAPALFTVAASGSGAGAILNSQGQVVSTANPVSAGDFISIYLTGEGKVDPDALDGRIAVGAASTNTPATVTIGGVAATVTYAGRAPGEVFGVSQINAQVPQGVASGNVPVQVTIGGVNSQANVTVAIQ
jgi:uncharacterized protein (TIGR03437 family)